MSLNTPTYIMFVKKHEHIAGAPDVIDGSNLCLWSALKALCLAFALCLPWRVRLCSVWLCIGPTTLLSASTPSALINWDHLVLVFIWQNLALQLKFVWSVCNSNSFNSFHIIMGKTLVNSQNYIISCLRLSLWNLGIMKSKHLNQPCFYCHQLVT